MNSIKRRKFLKNAALGSVATVLATNAHANTITPSEVEGPFYPITPQKDKDADMTRVEGKDGVAQGEIIEISGQVFDQGGNPVEDVTIDLWQANSFGKYHHPHDDSDAPVDPNFQGWAILKSGKQGRYKLKTVVPGAYPLGAPQQRTPHIHVKVSKLGFESLLSQIYFPDHPLNEKDGLFRRRTKAEQELMTAKKLSDDGNKFKFDFYIERV